MSDVFSDRVRSAGASLAPAARRVITFIDQNRAAVLATSATDLAARTGTSDATVIRAVQALGFSGLAELRQALLAAIEAPSSPAHDMRRTLDDLGETSDKAIDMVLEAHEEAVARLRSAESRAAMVAAAAILHPADRIVVFGVGPSAALIRYTALLLARNGRRTTTLDTTGSALADQLLGLRPNDALLVLAYGRAYREVTCVFGEARRLGLQVVLVTDGPLGRLAEQADVVLNLPRGRTERMALHGATLVALEALVPGLAAANRTGAIDSLDRLNALRRAVGTSRDEAW
jgi:DNA-binding MurR/RpiR family transcriptional regulator